MTNKNFRVFPITAANVYFHHFIFFVPAIIPTISKTGSGTKANRKTVKNGFFSNHLSAYFFPILSFFSKPDEPTKPHKYEACSPNAVPSPPTKIQIQGFNVIAAATIIIVELVGNNIDRLEMKQDRNKPIYPMVDIFCICSLHRKYGNANNTPTAMPAITDNNFFIFDLSFCIYPPQHAAAIAPPITKITITSNT